MRRSPRWSRRLALGAGMAVGVVAALGGQAMADWPEKPIRIIVPTQPGGAVDSTARVLQRYFDTSQVFGQNMVVVNMDGAGGAIATRAIKEAAPDGYTIGLWHEGLVTSRVMGVTDYDHDAFAVLGSTGYNAVGLGVGETSRIKDLDDLIRLGKTEPNTVKCATNVGLPVQFYPLMFQTLVGAEYRYVQTGGGALRMPSVVSLNTDFAIFATLEFVKWGDAGLRPLVLFDEKRSPALPDVPTAKEKGIDLVAYSSHIWLAPKGTPKEITDKLTDALRDAMKDPIVAKAFADAGEEDEFLEPAKVVAELDKMRDRSMPMVAKAREVQKAP
jgi:tripartite-type tricarboxylate transporter receptor subunit TctC